MWPLLIVLVLLVRGLEAGVGGPPDPVCPPQCPAECPALPDDCSHNVLDDCNCCSVCVREAGGRCGDGEGICGKGLHCSHLNSNDTGHCTPMYPERCLHAACAIVRVPQCPADSSLHVPPLPPGECCGQQPVCVCDPHKCASTVPACAGDGLERVLIEKATGVPADCCDRFECREKEVHCALAQCPPGPSEAGDDEGECPADSVRAPSYLPEGTCCPVHEGCRCRASVCRPAVCPAGKRVVVARKGTGSPGRCCDEWSCEDEARGGMAHRCVDERNRTWADGAEWHSTSCDLCKCKKGVSVCSKMTCPKIPSSCTWIVIPPKECCPVCHGCTTDQYEKKKKNETWQTDDCTTCTCSEEGAPVCEKHMCRTECENPRKVEGQCCPVCDEPTVLTLPATCPSLEHCDLRCEGGLRRDDTGCFVCDCVSTGVKHGANCTLLSKDNCDKQCAHGYTTDAAGCAVCKCAQCPPLRSCIKHCLYGFESNSAGCPVCKCRSMYRIDAKLTTEARGKHANSDKCVSITAAGKVVERDGGEWWNDGCRHCFCEQRQEFCSLISCAERPDTCPEEAWQQKDDACCPSCTLSTPSTSLAVKHEHTVCQAPGSGRLFTDGETWQLAACVSCTCRVGHVLCRVSACPPIACEDPIEDENNQCCPRCPPKPDIIPPLTDEQPKVCFDATKAVHAAGSDWREDECTSCTCTEEGTINCFRQSCEELHSCKGIPLVIKGRCCPVCSDALSSQSCEYAGVAYAAGERWSEGACRECRCETGGRVICKEWMCPACEHPLPQQDGQCCPQCTDVAWAAFGEAPPSLAPPRPTPSRNTLPIIGLSLVGVCLALALLVVFLLYRRRQFRPQSEKTTRSEASVRLVSSQARGERGELWARRRDDSAGDRHSDSLLSTASDSSSASSGNGPHPDTQPLTGKLLV